MNESLISEMILRVPRTVRYRFGQWWLLLQDGAAFAAVSFWELGCCWMAECMADTRKGLVLLWHRNSDRELVKLVYLLFDAFIAVLVIGFSKACHSCLGKSVLCQKGSRCAGWPCAAAVLCAGVERARNVIVEKTFLNYCVIPWWIRVTQRA